MGDSYTYSLVFAADMYATVFKGDPLDPALGKRYRDSILKVGGSREELDSLEVSHLYFLMSIVTYQPSYRNSLGDHRTLRRF